MSLLKVFVRHKGSEPSLDFFQRLESQPSRMGLSPDWEPDSYRKKHPLSNHSWLGSNICCPSEHARLDSGFGSPGNPFFFPTLVPNFRPMGQVLLTPNSSLDSVLKSYQRWWCKKSIKNSFIFLKKSDLALDPSGIQNRSPTVRARLGNKCCYPINYGWIEDVFFYRNQARSLGSDKF